MSGCEFAAPASARLCAFAQRKLPKLAGVVASQVHLVRHGEVDNPTGVLYERLAGFHLSERGNAMAQAVADDFRDRVVDVRAVLASPLERTRESAAPIADAYDIDVAIDERLIEPTNKFAGSVMREALRNPLTWRWVYNPGKPSWGEPFREVVQRMYSAIHDAFTSVDGGDVVLVSHQLPIWVTHLALARRRLGHDPRKRRCSLSSITTLARLPEGKVVEVDYREPAADLQSGAIDVGAV